MTIFVKEKVFYRQLLTIAVPVSLQSLIHLGVSMSDTIMLGMLSEVHLSAAALANQLGFIYALFTFGVAGGSNVMIAQYWGKRDVESIHRVLAIMYRALIVGGLIFTCLAFFFSRQVMGIFSTDTRVIEEGAKYLRIVGFGYLAMGMASTTVATLRSVGTVKIALGVYITSLCTSVFLNWVLIFGNLGAPRLEIQGAAISTAIARFVELIIVWTYMYTKESKIRYRIKYLFMRKIGLMRDFIKNAGPVVVNEIVWGTGAATLAAIIGRMSTEFTAANSIMSVLSQLIHIAGYGVASAAAVIVGNVVGAGDYAKARAYGNTLMFMSLGMGILSSITIHILKIPLLSFYNVSDTVLLYARQLINISSVLVIFQAMAHMAIVGVLRGGGDTRFALFIDILFMWALCIPLGFLTGLHLGWAVPVVFFTIKIDDFFKGGSGFIRVIRGNWVNDVTVK